MRNSDLAAASGTTPWSCCQLARGSQWAGRNPPPPSANQVRYLTSPGVLCLWISAALFAAGFSLDGEGGRGIRAGWNPFTDLVVIQDGQSFRDPRARNHYNRKAKMSNKVSDPRTVLLLVSYTRRAR
jgi:hypothetical protein